MRWADPKRAPFRRAVALGLVLIGTVAEAKSGARKANQAPQLQVSTTKEAVKPGDVNIVKILISNPTSSTLRNIRVSTTLPERIDNFFGFRVLGQCNSLFSYCGPGSVLSWEMNPLAPGESGILMFGLKAPKRAKNGKSSSSIVATADGWRREARYVHRVKKKKSPFVAVNLEDEQVPPGGQVSGTVLVSNPARKAVGSFEVVLSAKKGFKLAHRHSSQYRKRRSWQLPAGLQPGERVVVPFDLKVARGARGGSSQRLEARVIAGDDLLAGGSQIFSVSSPKLSVTIDLYSQQAAPSTLLYAALSVFNHRSTPVQDVLLYATLPDHAEKFFDYIVGGECQTIRTNYCSPGNQIYWLWDELPGRSRKTVYLPLKVEPRDPVGFDFDEEPDLGAQLHVMAGVRGGGSLGGHATASVPIVKREPWLVSFAGEYGPVTSGSTMELRPTVHNLTDSELQGVSLELLLPSGASATSASDDATMQPRSVAWSIDRVAPGASVGRTVALRVNGRPGDALQVHAIAKRGEEMLHEKLLVFIEKALPFRVEIETEPEVPVRGEDVVFRFLVHNDTGKRIKNLKLGVQTPDYFEPDRWFARVGALEPFEKKRLKAGETWEVEFPGEILDERWPWANHENVSRPGEVLMLRAVPSAKGYSEPVWQRAVSVEDN